MSKVKKIVLSGGPFSGKSTLVKEFKKIGLPVAEEAALTVIEELNNSIGIKEQIKFRDSNINEFQNMILDKQIHFENQAIKEAIQYKNDYIICDRGVYDALSYYELFKRKINSEILDKIESIHYDFSFICDVLPNFDTRPETGRFETFETSKKLSEHSYKIYSKYVENTIFLPVMSVEERLDFITDYIN